MWKFISIAINVWRLIAPIYNDVMKIIDAVKQMGLTDDEARKKVIQTVTDIVQTRGLSKVPDSVLNTGLELCYQVYRWKQA